MKRNQWRSISALTLAGALLTAAVGCASTPADDQEQAGTGPEGLASASAVKHCISLSYPPLEYYENGSDGEIIGWDVDSMRAVAEHWGVDYELDVLAFDGLIPSLHTGQCDVVWSGMYVNEARSDVANVSPVLQTGSQIVLHERHEGGPSSREDICGMNIAAQQASEDLGNLEQLSQECVDAGLDAVNISAFPGTLDALATIRDGRIDGLIDTTVLTAELVTLNDDMITVDGLFEMDYWFGAYTNQGTPLGDELREALIALSDDGTLQALAEEYGLNPDHVATADILNELSVSN